MSFDWAVGRQCRGQRRSLSLTMPMMMKAVRTATQRPRGGDAEAPTMLAMTTTMTTTKRWPWLGGIWPTLPSWQTQRVRPLGRDAKRLEWRWGWRKLCERRAVARQTTKTTVLPPHPRRTGDHQHQCNLHHATVDVVVLVVGGGGGRTVPSGANPQQAVREWTRACERKSDESETCTQIEKVWIRWRGKRKQNARHVMMLT